MKTSFFLNKGMRRIKQSSKFCRTFAKSFDHHYTVILFFMISILLHFIPNPIIRIGIRKQEILCYCNWDPLVLFHIETSRLILDLLYSMIRLGRLKLQFHYLLNPSRVRTRIGQKTHAQKHFNEFIFNACYFKNAFPQRFVIH